MNNSFQKMKYMWPIDEMKKSQHPTSEKCKSKYTKFPTSGSQSNTKIYSLPGLKE